MTNEPTQSQMSIEDFMLKARREFFGAEIIAIEVTPTYIKIIVDRKDALGDHYCLGISAALGLDISTVRKVKSSKQKSLHN